MKTVVVRNIKRTEPDLVKRLGALGVATAHEAYGRFGLMKPYLRPVWSGAEASGTAVTVLAQPGDNWMIHVAVEQCKPGDILVVGCSDRQYRRHVRRSAGDLADGARRQGPRHRRRRSRRQGAARNGLSGVVEGDLGQGHGEGDARRGQRAGGLRRDQRQCRAMPWSPTTTASW